MLKNMSKFNRFFVIALIFVMAGCGGGGGKSGGTDTKQGDSQKLIGVWQLTKNTATDGTVFVIDKSVSDIGYIFKEDGNYEFHNVGGGENLQDFGTFTFDEAAKKITQNSISGETLFLEDIVFIDDNSFTSLGDPIIKDSLTWERVIS